MTNKERGKKFIKIIYFKIKIIYFKFKSEGFYLMRFFIDIKILHFIPPPAPSIFILPRPNHTERNSTEIKKKSESKKFSR